jgi:hypothetical protein
MDQKVRSELQTGSRLLGVGVSILNHRLGSIAPISLKLGSAFVTAVLISRGPCEPGSRVSGLSV